MIKKRIMLFISFSLLMLITRFRRQPHWLHPVGLLADPPSLSSYLNRVYPIIFALLYLYLFTVLAGVFSLKSKSIRTRLTALFL